MNKRVEFAFSGMQQDLAKSKHPNKYYYEGNNIRITATDKDSTGSITNEKGNKLVLSIPTPEINHTTSVISYGNKTLKYKGNSRNKQAEINKQLEGKVSGVQEIIGHSVARNSVILFTTDSNGFDCIWRMSEEFDIKLLYIRDLGFNINNPIQAIFNYENEIIQKVYWVDGNNQLRFLNLEHSKENENVENLIDVNSNTINIVGNFDISEPVIEDTVSGGTHTAGMVQYAYNLYRINSSQTKLSPLSELIPLNKGKGLGGGEINEIVGTTPIVSIKNIDPEYTHIKVYAVKYTSYNQIPTISLIKDQQISGNRSLNIFDDGSVINDISLSEFLFLGSDPVVPKHIEAKDNILFPANIKELNFDIDLDTRAYSYPQNQVTTRVYENVRLLQNRITGSSQVVGSTYNISENHDSINLDYDVNKYQRNSSVLGGEGKYLKYELVQNTTLNSPEDKRFFKDNEIYRLGIQFYNRLGQKSFPKWMADFKAPEGNLEGKYNTIKVTLKPEFYVWLNTSENFESENDKPIGYKILRANRTENDKTIITQGFLNGMISNYRTDSKTNIGTQETRDNAEKGNKLPSLQRPFGKHHAQMDGMEHYRNLDGTFGSFQADDMREVHAASSKDNWIAQSFQYNVLIQMFSPEVLFENISLYEGLNVRVKGALKNNRTQFWGQIRKISTKEVLTEGKVLNGLTGHEDILFDNTQELNISGNGVNAMTDLGIFGPESREGDVDMAFYQFNRDFTGDYIKGNNKSYNVYGKPTLTEKGQGSTPYNNDTQLSFYNSLEPMLADGGDSKGENSPAITSVNTWGNKCITLVLGPNNKEYNVVDRPKLEELWEDSGITESNVMLIAELVKNKQQIYLGNIYGGNSFEDKKRTNYIEIGDYKDISTDTVTINSPGDTFVNIFKFAKLLKTDTEVYAASSLQITEILQGKIETTVDLKNRHDISLLDWDSRFQPRDDEYHKYNRVYSQQSTLMQNQDVDYTFRRVNDFDTRIMATKVKVPGENIDSWTDLLVNETLDLNGKYGPINGLVSFRDNIFALQDKSLVAIAINPRVQVQGSDGIAVELGSGRVLHDYNYITTNSGTLNKWGIIPTEYAIYYLDNINKCLVRFAGQSIEKLSDKLGMHTWFQNNVNYDTVKTDNPYLFKGVNLAYDSINNDVLLTLHQDNSKTLLFNEATNSFVSFMDYKPSLYINTNNKLLSTNNNKDIYQHFEGDYNEFYGVKYPSNVTLLAKPVESDAVVFNTIRFNSEMYKNNQDVFDKTISHIRAWNEYQDSTKVPLVFNRGANLNRTFREWNASIPRDGRSRIRNPWTYLLLELQNEDNYELILHNIIVNYTIN